MHAGDITSSAHPFTTGAAAVRQGSGTSAVAPAGDTGDVSRAVFLLLLTLLTGACTPSPMIEGVEQLQVTRQRDGDSFVASDGVEYRVGLINTPELAECGGQEAKSRTTALLADGFTVDSYARDDNGRQVARIQTTAGDLGVILAAEGLADDRYLETFRSENPSYAADLDRAFQRARDGSRGFWQSCWSDSSAELPADSDPAVADQTEFQEQLLDVPTSHTGRTGEWFCHPAYVVCIPDGPDLDCAQVGHQVPLIGTADPFRLDGNSVTATDGVGCDSYAPWSADEPYPYYPEP